MTALDNHFGLSAAALKVRAQRMDLLASNIANAATPNYKARDIDFGAVMKAAADGSAASVRRSHVMHLPAAAGADQRAAYRIPQQASLDGNTVELQTEQVAFAENSVRYEATLNVLNGRIRSLMSAIRGE